MSVRLLACVLAASAVTAAACGDDQIELKTPTYTLSEGALKVELFETQLFGRSLHVIRARLPKDANFRVQASDEPKRLPELIPKGPSVVAVNGGFYDQEGRAMGLVLQDGRRIRDLRRGGGSGAVLFDADGFRVVHRTNVPDSGITQGLQSIDRVVDSGTSLVAENASTTRDARSAIATFDDGAAAIYVIFASPAEVDDANASERTFRLDEVSTRAGVSLRELSELLVAEGAAAALNLDGGWSTSFEARLGGRELRVLSFRPTINALVAVP